MIAAEYAQIAATFNLCHLGVCCRLLLFCSNKMLPQRSNKDVRWGATRVCSPMPTPLHLNDEELTSVAGASGAGRLWAAVGIFSRCRRRIGGLPSTRTGRDVPHCARCSAPVRPHVAASAAARARIAVAHREHARPKGVQSRPDNSSRLAFIGRGTPQASWGPLPPGARRPSAGNVVARRRVAQPIDGRGEHDDTEPPRSPAIDRARTMVSGLSVSMR
jgi:hypothetical protein